MFRLWFSINNFEFAAMSLGLFLCFPLGCHKMFGVRKVTWQQFCNFFGGCCISDTNLSLEIRLFKKKKKEQNHLLFNFLQKTLQAKEVLVLKPNLFFISPKNVRGRGYSFIDNQLFRTSCKSLRGSGKLFANSFPLRLD